MVVNSFLQGSRSGTQVFNKCPVTKSHTALLQESPRTPLFLVFPRTPSAPVQSGKPRPPTPRRILPLTSLLPQ
ncbi:rCG51689 [Rattus norvegicus]|uniref:RCG51689 n=1 Tax=Rattus norvegicus TaxID=10116 RepID=A6IZX3_RAT|nr:rCG51689 [Rattus norvegicus]